LHLTKNQVLKSNHIQTHKLKLHDASYLIQNETQKSKCDRSLKLVSKILQQMSHYRKMKAMEGVVGLQGFKLSLDL